MCCPLGEEGRGKCWEGRLFARFTHVWRQVVHLTMAGIRGPLVLFAVISKMSMVSVMFPETTWKPVGVVPQSMLVWSTDTLPIVYREGQSWCKVPQSAQTSFLHINKMQQVQSPGTHSTYHLDNPGGNTVGRSAGEGADVALDALSGCKARAREDGSCG